MLMTDYKLAFGEYPNSFGDDVSRYVRQGWQPKGDVFSNSKYSYNQVLVRYAKPLREKLA